MKFNWGTGIVAAFALFISFILFFIITVQVNPEYDRDLVRDEYYKHDAQYSQEMGRYDNERALEERPQISVGETTIEVKFPLSIATDSVRGTVSLYRPSDKTLDFEKPISLSGHTLLIPKANLAGGRWDIILIWNYKGTDYQKKQTLYLE